MMTPLAILLMTRVAKKQTTIVMKKVMMQQAHRKVIQMKVLQSTKRSDWMRQMN